jgi:hypothetical protein
MNTPSEQSDQANGSTAQQDQGDHNAQVKSEDSEDTGEEKAKEKEFFEDALKRFLRTR